MTFVLVGGGPTGVELAGALGEIANDTLRNDFRSIRPQDARIVLVEAMDRVLPTYPPGRSASARRQLERLGVVVRTQTQVIHIEEGLVRVRHPDGAEEEIHARTVLWAAGVLAASFGRKVAAATGAETDRNGRIRVLPDLTIPGHPEIFVVGDAAIQPWKPDRPTPGVAQGGIQGGTYAAKSILARLHGEPVKPYRYSNRGDVAVIGRLRGVTDIPWLGPFGQQGGFTAWLLWLLIHITYLIGFANRIVVVTRWAFSFLTKGRSTRLITGQPLVPPIEAPLAIDRHRRNPEAGAGARGGPALGGDAAPRPALGDEPSQPFDARLDGAFGDPAVAEDEAARTRLEPLDARPPMPIPAPPPRRRSGLVHVVGQPRQDVEARRRADRSHVRQVAGQRLEQHVAPTAVDRSHPPEVVVELAALDDVGERELVERRGAHVRGDLGGDQRVDHRGRGDQPAEPQPRGEDLARRPA